MMRLLAFICIASSLGAIDSAIALNGVVDIDNNTVAVVGYDKAKKETIKIIFKKVMLQDPPFNYKFKSKKNTNKVVPTCCINIVSSNIVR